VHPSFVNWVVSDVDRALRACAARIIHHEQRHAVVIDKVADADLVPIATEICEADRALVENRDCKS
jgi:hypothetical protein